VADVGYLTLYYAPSRPLALPEFSACAKGYHQAPSDEKGVPSAPTWREASSSPTLRALDIGTFLAGIKPLRRKPCMCARGPRLVSLSLAQEFTAQRLALLRSAKTVP